MTAFRFDYAPPTIRYGPGCVAALREELDRQSIDRALVVCGATVGSTPAVIDPVRAGLGERCADVFAETTPAKRLDTAVAAATRFDSVDADGIVALGGGSSLDVAKATSVVAASDATPGELGEHFEETGTLPMPDGPLVPVVAVPTTLAGADLSQLAGLTAHPDAGLVTTATSGGIGDPRLMPAAVCYDPELVATTPRDVLAGSAMNGFDKGIETLYAHNATPVTDGTAVRGLQLLVDALPTLTGKDPAFESIVQGIVLVQYGISRPDGTTLSLIHAFGHGLKTHADIQQGVAHAVVAPHALAFVLDHVDGRQAILAAALDVPEPNSTAIVDRVAGVRDALGLPSRLRDLDSVRRSMLGDVAETTAADSMLGNVPAGVDPTVSQLRGILERAW